MDQPLIDLRKLQVFLKVYETRSFSKTSKLLYLAQPTITLHIKDLENILGVKLLDRNTRKVIPSKAGKVVYKYGKEILNLFTSYCSMCLVELKTLNKLNNACKSDKYKIVSLLVDRQGVTVLPKIVNSNNITYTVGIAPSNIFKIFPDFSITPTTYILNQNGNLVERVVGYKNLKSWIDILNKYVNCN